MSIPGKASHPSLTARQGVFFYAAQRSQKMYRDALKRTGKIRNTSNSPKRIEEPGIHQFLRSASRYIFSAQRIREISKTAPRRQQDIPMKEELQVFFSSIDRSNRMGLCSSPNLLRITLSAPVLPPSFSRKAKVSESLPRRRSSPRKDYRSGGIRAGSRRYFPEG